MTETSRPLAEKNFTDVNGERMCFLGENPSIVFQHGNPT
jgi:hypothetical protein